MIGRILLLAACASGLLASSDARAAPGATIEPAALAMTAPAPAAGPVVDLNAASVQELCTLPGIGPRKAEAIVSLREKRPFTRVTQLLLVKGIGPKTLARLKPRLMVGPPAAATAPSTARQ